MRIEDEEGKVGGWGEGCGIWGDVVCGLDWKCV